LTSSDLAFTAGFLHLLLLTVLDNLVATPKVRSPYTWISATCSSLGTLQASSNLDDASSPAFNWQAVTDFLLGSRLWGQSMRPRSRPSEHSRNLKPQFEAQNVFSHSSRSWSSNGSQHCGMATVWNKRPYNPARIHECPDE
jgi:hypothetical protein